MANIWPIDYHFTATLKRKGKAKNRAFSLSDETSSIEIVADPDILKKKREVSTRTPLLLAIF